MKHESIDLYHGLLVVRVCALQLGYAVNAARLNAAIDDLEPFCKRACTDDQHCRYCLMEGGRLDNDRIEGLPVGVDPALWFDPAESHG